MRLFIHGVALTLIAALFLAPPSNAPAAPQIIPALRPRPQDVAHGVAGEAFPALADDIVAPPALFETTAATSDYLVVPIYFVPHDRVPDQRLVDLINNRMRWVQAWYGWQIGDRTFTLADAVTVIGNHNRDWYYDSHDGADRVWSQQVWTNISTELDSRGYAWSSTRVYGMFFDHGGRGGPALGGGTTTGGGKFIFAADRLVDDCGGVECRSSVDDGGIAHELGHALGLGHIQPDLTAVESVMGMGFYEFPQIGLLNTTINPEISILRANPMLSQPLRMSNPSFENCLDDWGIGGAATPSCVNDRHSGLAALRLPPSAAPYQVEQRLRLDQTAGDQPIYDIGLWVNIGGGITLYSAPNYTGTAETFITSDPALADNAIGEDRAQSIRVQPGRSATLWVNPYFQEPAEILYADDPDLSNNIIGAGRTSSVQIAYTSHALPASIDLDIRVEFIDAGGRVIGAEAISLADTYGRGWVRVGRSLHPPTGADWARLVIDVQRLGAADGLLIDDLTLDQPAAVPPRPYQVYETDPMPYATRRPTLAWRDVAQALDYQIQVDADPTFTSPEVNVITRQPIYALPSDLAWGQAYAWRVRARNGKGAGAWLYAGQMIAQPGAAYRSDEFEGHDLDPDWSWVREGHWAWGGPNSKGYRGELVLFAQRGTLYGAGGNASGLLLRQVPGDAVAVVTHMRYSNSAPQNSGEQTGMIVYQDDDNFITLVRTTGSTGMVGLTIERDGHPVWYPVVANQHMYYMRIERRGASYRGLFSSDGMQWQQVGPDVVADWPQARIGLFSWSGGSSNQVETHYEFFRVTDLPAPPLPTATTAPTSMPSATAAPAPTATATPGGETQGQRAGYLPLIVR